MGGDSFEGVERLTNQQFIQIVAQITKIIAPFCQKLQAYIPLPEKVSHGDVDFLVILKKPNKPTTFIQLLKIQKYKINKNDTIHTVYRNKQIDFCFVENEEQFSTFRFYKAYSGMGAYLGMFLPSKQIKLSDTGLYALGYHKHLKLQFLLTKDIKTILNFYGLDYERFCKGFETRKQLFQYLRRVRFLNEAHFVEKGKIYQQIEQQNKQVIKNQQQAQNIQQKNESQKSSQQGQKMEQKKKKKIPVSKRLSKIAEYFIEYLKTQGLKQREYVKYQDPLQETLNYFHKKEAYEKQFKNMIQQKQREQQLNKKFNATHVMKRYNLSGKKLNDCKKQFRQQFGSQSQYYKFIEENQVEKIIEDFGKCCKLEQ